MVMARMAQPRPVKIGIPARPPMVGRVVDEHIPQVAGDEARRRRASANRVLSYLKAALNHAWRAGIVPSDDAWRRVKPFRAVEAPVIRYLSHDEITRLLNACQGGFRNLVHAGLLTGCRYGELCRLQVGDYNGDVGTLTIRAAKGGSGRHVTLTSEAPELIDRVIAGRS